jgi:hypothetical protein
MSSPKAQAILKEIKSQGYWQVVIRPATEAKPRVTSEVELDRIVTDNQVRMRGWPFPYVSHQEPIDHGVGFAEQASSWDWFLDYWRLTQTGQFLYLGAFKEDWESRGGFRSPRPGKPGEYLSVGNVIYRFAEILEFASKFSQSEAGADAMLVEIAAFGLAGREVAIVDPARAEFDYPRKTVSPHWVERRSIGRAELQTRHEEIACEMCARFFGIFGWKTDAKFIQEYLDTLRRR